MLRSDHQEFFKIKICANVCHAPELNRLLMVWLGPVTYGDFLMRSKLAISALVVTSLFGSTLVVSAQSQTAPGASNEGTVSPGATSGKKTQHEKRYDHRVGHAQRRQQRRRGESIGSRQRWFRRR